MDSLIQDVRYAIRSLGRAKGFMAVVVAVMALGIGVNTMLFGIYDAIILRPWPLPGIRRIVSIALSEPARDIHNVTLSWQTFRDLQERSKSYEALGGLWDMSAIVTIDRDPERFEGATITSGLFPALGVAPQLGRNFTRDEEVWGRNWTQVVISDRLWRTRFHADPAALGRTIRVNGRVRAIVGVMPPKFAYPQAQDIWIPAGFDATTDHRGDAVLRTVGRLRPGVSVAQAHAECNTIVATLARTYPELKSYVGSVMNLQDRWTRNVSPLLNMMLFAVLFVLAIACANVANLMLARAATRRREISMRLALGATRGRVIRQLLTESLLLSGIGAAFGLVVSHYGHVLWMRGIPVELPFFIDFRLTAGILGYTAVIAMLAGVLFGLTPALHATDTHLAEALREGSVQSGASRGQRRLRNALVVAEVALSLVLLIGAGLMLRTVQRFERSAQGLRLDRMVTGRVLLPVANYPNESDRRRFFEEMDARLRRERGVTEVAAFSDLPLGMNSSTSTVLLPGQEDPHRGVNSYSAYAMPGAFGVLGLPLLRGREFTSQDDERALRVAVVNDGAARRLWPGRDPIGQRLRLSGEPDSLGWATVVGVVANIDQNVEDDTPTPYSVWLAEYQEPAQLLSVLVRADGGPEQGAGALRRVVRALNPDLAVTEVRSLREEFHFSLWVRRIFGSLIGAFGAIALIIAAVGLYGVMAYSVAQRTQEIGIRMALGADAYGVQRMVVGGALRLTALGVGIGLATAFAVTRFMSQNIPGVSPTDPPTFTLVTVLLMFSGLLAAWVPSLRATRVDPMLALRAE